MGNSGGKSEKKKVGLSEEQVRLVKLRLFKDGQEERRITPRLLESHWVELLGPSLTERFLRYLFPGGSSSVELETFLGLYTSLCRSGPEARAETLLRLLKADDAVDVPVETFVQFVRDLWSSYVKILMSAENSRIKSWMSARVRLDKDDLYKFAKFFSRDLEAGDGTVGVGEIEAWLLRNSVATDVFGVVVDTAYFLDGLSKNEALLPQAVMKEANGSLLSLGEVLFLGTSLPRELSRTWRKLFSTLEDGASWTTMVKSLVGQGPTLVVVEDLSGALFGGFASESWKLRPTFYGNENSFLFTLRPEMARFDSSGYSGNYQYLNQGQQTLPNGMAMGGQTGYWGLYIDSQFGVGRVSESCSTFRHYTALSGEDPFRIKDLEVWGVGAADPTPRELGEREPDGRTTSALGRDPTAEAMLEAAGRQFHSRGFRDNDNDG